MKTYTVKVDKNGDKHWYINNKRHREDGPACEYADGTKEWYLNGELHRKDGPAIEWSNGDKYWFLSGKLHRKDGPAVEHADGTKYWYLNGKELTQKQFDARNKPSCAGKVVEIDGVKYTLTKA